MVTHTLPHCPGRTLICPPSVSTSGYQPGSLRTASSCPGTAARRLGTFSTWRNWLRVLPERLPEQKLIFTQWLHWDCIAQQHRVEMFGERFWALLEAYVKTAADYGSTWRNSPLVPSRTQEPKTLEGFFSSR